MSAAAWASVLGLHLLLTFVMTYPALLRFHTHLFNGPLGDKLEYMWVFWWVRHSLLMTHQSPLYTEMIYAPTGVSLVLNDMMFFWSALSVPLQAVMDLPTILNAFLLVSLPLNGIAFFRLAQVVTGGFWGSLTGSVLFAYCPFLLGRFRVDHVGVAAVFFVPLFLLELWRHSRCARAVHLAKSGLYLALTTLTMYYNGVLLLIILVAYLSHHVWTCRARWHALDYWRRFMRHVAVMSLCPLVLLAPIAVPTLVQIARGDYAHATHRESYRYLEGSSADLVAYFVPDYSVAVWRGWTVSDTTRHLAATLWDDLSGNRYEKATYPGWISWACLTLGLAWGRLRRRAWPWVAVALSGFIFTLGPTLHINGDPYLQGMLPMRFWHLIPVFNLVRGLSRFAFLVPLGAGMVLALAVALLEESRRGQLGRRVSVLALSFVVIEFLPVSVQVVPKAVWLSPFYTWMAHEPGDFVALNVPAAFQGARGGGGLYSYLQLAHGKRIIGGYISHVPERALRTREHHPFLQAVEHREYEEDRRLRLSCAALVDMHATLAKLDVRYVVVHKVFLPGAEWSRVNEWLRRGLGTFIYEDRYIRVYRYEADRMLAPTLFDTSLLEFAAAAADVERSRAMTPGRDGSTTTCRARTGRG